ncbi:hypothetical protein LXA43DRAFT_1187303, partial [Ganoderma leucocontextum]
WPRPRCLGFLLFLIPVLFLSVTLTWSIDAPAFPRSLFPISSSIVLSLYLNPVLYGEKPQFWRYDDDTTHSVNSRVIKTLVFPAPSDYCAQRPRSEGPDSHIF